MYMYRRGTGLDASGVHNSYSQQLVHNIKSCTVKTIRMNDTGMEIFFCSQFPLYWIVHSRVYPYYALRHRILHESRLAPVFVRMVLQK